MIDILEAIKKAKSISVDMFNNKLILDDEDFYTYCVVFNCNWSKQNIVEVISSHTLNAESHNITYKNHDDVKINLEIKETILLKTDKHELISIGYYRTDNEINRHTTNYRDNEIIVIEFGDGHMEYYVGDVGFNCLVGACEHVDYNIDMG